MQPTTRGIRPASRATNSHSMNVRGIKHLLVVTALAGIFSGLLLTLVQRIQVVPLILEAERYERAASPSVADAHDHSHDANQEHAHAAWQPAQGWERTIYTAMANIFTAFGFALLLSAATMLRNKAMSWRSGLVWGLGGYLTFFVAPSLGLPPELPGTESAALVSRQIWWAGTAIATGGGLWLVIFSRRNALRIAGAALLVVPHLLGAPQPEFHNSTAPDQLAQAFFTATLIANATLWLSLGGLFGFLQGRAN